MKPSGLLLLAAALGSTTEVNAQLQINELMQSNIDCIMDDLNEFPDSWVELHNIGTASVNLSDYSLSDENNPAEAYQLPAKTIAPGGYIVIYCDKAATGLHTPFRLDSGKGAAVYLFKNGAIADKVEGLKKQPAPNIAYGRSEENSETWGYQATATPGAPNCRKLCTDILGAPVFSTPGRVASTTFNLYITLPDNAPEGTVIRYTTDGTEPTESSRKFGYGLNISASTTIRAKLFHPDYLSPRSTTHSYIFLPREMTIPIVSMVTDRRYFYDNTLGIYTEGHDKNNPNYQHDWRRPINFELFTAEGEASVINQLCETRVKGGASRGAQLKSLAVYANKRFGEKRFNHEFFPDEATGLDEWKSIEMRNSGNDFDYTYFRDALIQRVMGTNCDLDWQPWLPTAFFINGEYKGMLNIRSRSNEDHIYTFYNGEEDIDMIESWKELKEGSWDNYNSFKEFYNQDGHTFDEFNSLMDCGEFANLMIMNLFYDNKDFPGNNIVFWRPRSDGGKWRWIAKDTDFGLGLYEAPYNYKTFNWLYENSYDQNHNWANKPEHTRLFRALMNTPEFRDMFIDRCAVYMGDFMNYRGTVKEIDKMYGMIRKEYPYHRKLVNQWWPNHPEEVQKMRTWVSKRTPFFYTHLSDYYKLGTPRTLTIDAGRTDDITLTVNGISLNNRDFDGQFFAGRQLLIEAGHKEEGMAIGSWKITVTSGSNKATAEYKGAVLSLTMPDADKVEIESIATQSSIAEIEANPKSGGIDFSQPFKLYDIQGRLLMEAGSAEATGKLAKGLYIVRQGENAAKMQLGGR